MTDPYALLQATILGVVEGLTEFLPVSSTGHLILANRVVGLPEPLANVFEVVIQLGAILAICVLYFGRLWHPLVRLPSDPGARRFALSVIVAFLPAAVLGALLHDVIKTYLFSDWVVVATMIVGGVAILLIERVHAAIRYREAEALPVPVSFGVGLCQCLAMVPGVSRSGASILGALMLGVERRAAAEFSFFLAIPTMLGAFTLDLWKARHDLHGSDLLIIATGFVVAFIVAVVVVRAFVAYLARHDFTVFGWYRIIAGIAIAAVLLLER